MSIVCMGITRRAHSLNLFHAISIQMQAYMDKMHFIFHTTAKIVTYAMNYIIYQHVIRTLVESYYGYRHGKDRRHIRNK